MEGGVNGTPVCLDPGKSGFGSSRVNVATTSPCGFTNENRCARSSTGAGLWAGVCCASTGAGEMYREITPPTRPASKATTALIRFMETSDLDHTETRAGTVKT